MKSRLTPLSARPLRTGRTTARRRRGSRPPRGPTPSYPCVDHGVVQLDLHGWPPRSGRLPWCGGRGSSGRRNATTTAAPASRARAAPPVAVAKPWTRARSAGPRVTGRADGHGVQHRRSHATADLHRSGGGGRGDAGLPRVDPACHHADRRGEHATDAQADQHLGRQDHGQVAADWSELGQQPQPAGRHEHPGGDQRAGRRGPSAGSRSRRSCRPRRGTSAGRRARCGPGCNRARPGSGRSASGTSRRCRPR